MNFPFSPKRYLVILADRQKARFFTLYKNKVEDKGESYFDDVPQKVKAEGTREGKMARHIRDHLYRHLKLVGQRARLFLQRRKLENIDGILIGSHKELFKQIKYFLPTNLKEKVTGEFITELKIPIHQIIQKALGKLRFS